MNVAGIMDNILYIIWLKWISCGIVRIRYKWRLSYKDKER